MLEIDEGLLARIAEGDREAFAELYRQTDRTVYAFALSLLKDREEASDVMHDAYLKIFSAAGTYEPQGKPLAWIFTIVKNLALMKFRERKRAGGELPDDLSESSTGERTDQCVTNRVILEAALELLGEEERQIVLLHAVSGLRHREIAEWLELPLSTVLSRYQRALAKLRKHMEGGETA